MAALDWLTTEIRTDPLGWLYATLDTWQTTARLNDATQARPVAVHAVTDADLLAALAAGLAELSQLPASAWNIINIVVQVSGRHTFDPSSAAYQGMVNGFFPAASFPATNAAFLALASRNGSRAEELAGAGTVVSVDEVQAAREAADLV